MYISPLLVVLPVTLTYVMLTGSSRRVAISIPTAVWEYDALKQAGASDIEIADAAGNIVSIDALRKSALSL